MWKKKREESRKRTPSLSDYFQTKKTSSVAELVICKNAIKRFLKDFSPINWNFAMRTTEKSSVLVSLKYLIVVLIVGLRNSGDLSDFRYFRNKLSFYS